MFWDLLTWTNLLVWSDPAWAFPIRTDCVTIFLNVVARGGTVIWNRHITPDLCLVTSWLLDLIYVILQMVYYCASHKAITGQRGVVKYVRFTMLS
jgi:hypothetical protein